MNDVLGHPIRVGDTILTTPYWEQTMTCITKVIRVTKKRVHVKVPSNYYGRVDQVVARHPHQVVVITNQLKYNKKHFPENLV